MHNMSFVFDGNVFTITFQSTLRDGLVFSYGVKPYRGLWETLRQCFLGYVQISASVGWWYGRAASS